MRQDLDADGCCSMSYVLNTMNLHFFQNMCNYRQFSSLFIDGVFQSGCIKKCQTDESSSH